MLRTPSKSKMYKVFTNVKTKYPYIFEFGLFSVILSSHNLQKQSHRNSTSAQRHVLENDLIMVSLKPLWPLGLNPRI